MDRIQIKGGAPLHGTIPISGAKNAALPLMIASLLTDQTLELTNVPRLADIASLLRILGNHGVDHAIAGKRPGQTAETGQTLRLTARAIIDTCAPYELVSTMRASFWVVAPLLARFGEACVSLPGGCAIGTRPVDLLIMALERLGAAIDIDGGYVIAKAPKGLRGAEIVFPKVTVGGTHVALMAAALAQGATVIENAAREPEVVDLADCLVKMGARISGAGSSRIVVEGVSRLTGASHDVLPDRIETGTYAMAVAMTGGDVLLQNTRPELLQAALDVLAQSGAEVAPTNEGIRIRRNGGGIAAVDVTTDPFPGFPTDLQAQFMALMTRAQRHLPHSRDDFREPLHARAGVGAAWRAHPARWRRGLCGGRRAVEGRAGDGDGPARLRVARHRGTRRRGRDHHQPGLPPRPRLRGAGGEAVALRRRYLPHPGVRRGAMRPALPSRRTIPRRRRA